MIKGSGCPVCAGIAIGKIFVLSRQGEQIDNTKSFAPNEQLELFYSAREAAKKELQSLYENTMQSLGADGASIIEVQTLILDDIDYTEGVESLIKGGYSAAFAVKQTGANQSSALEALDDEYLKARAADVLDVTDRLLRVLAGKVSTFSMDEPCIILAQDLSPSEILSMDKSNALAFVTRAGSPQSHAAILARAMNIPFLVMADVKIEPSLSGKRMVVDSFSGEWFIDPDDKTLSAMEEKAKGASEAKAALEVFRGKESVTNKGKRISLFANIGVPEDIKAAIEGDAEGIGLLRSEFLYLGRDALPTEDELFSSYKEIVQAIAPKPVIIRTIDIGADKELSYLKLPKEENPALGLRGIRLCLARLDIFKAQLKAIYRASAFGNVSIMFPMIISLEEVRSVKAICQEVMDELLANGEAVQPIPLGIMIETPAAALISDLLAKEVDFFSVGTNDLTQYTLAVDRQNASIQALYNPHHEALTRMLALVAKNAREAGIRAGICGELAGDFSLTDELIKMGYDELSVAPSKILELRKKILESDATPDS